MPIVLQMSLHLLSPAQFYPPLPGELLEIGAVEVKKESLVEELKMMILTLPAVSHYNFKTVTLAIVVFLVFSHGI